MAEIPKIAQRRIQDEQLRGEVSHPDADLLTAFAEQALTVRERDQVLMHLAQCADCREVAALAGGAVAEPEPVAAAVVGKPAVRKTGRFWPLRPLRWTAVAATAAVVLSAVWLNRKEITRQELPAGTETNPAIMQSQSKPASTPPDQHAKNEVTAAPSAPTSDKESVSQPSGFRADSATKLDALAKTKAASPKSRAEVEGGAGNSASAYEFLAEKKQSTNGAVADQKDMPLLRSREVGQLQSAKVSPNQAIGGPVLAGSAAAAKMERALPSAQPVSSTDMAVAQQSAPKVPEVTMTYSRKTAAELAPAAQVAESQVNASGAKRDSASQVRVGPMATPLPDDQASLGTLQKSLDLKSAGTLWRVSSSGELQQSTDSGHNWRTALGEHPSRFKAVASAGAIVWAGGDDGALWSSLNNGLTWRKLAPSLDGHSPRGSVESIQLAAPRNVTFRTSAGETWSSPDGGINWTMKPE